MKLKTLSFFAFAAMLMMSACHYGVDAVEEDLKRNEEYKGKKAEREAATKLPENALGASTDTAAADTSAVKK